MVSIGKVSAKKAVIKWKKIAGVSGYQIQYAASSKFKKAKTLTAGKKATSKSVSKLKKSTRYYVRVRSYKKSNGKKVYSSWSKAKSFKTKKK